MDFVSMQLREINLWKMKYMWEMSIPYNNLFFFLNLAIIFKMPSYNYLA
jgi:hypothetical protein